MFRMFVLGSGLARPSMLVPAPPASAHGREIVRLSVRFLRRLAFNPLPQPGYSEALHDVSSEHCSDKHKPKSRTREIRRSGSIRSPGWQHPGSNR